MKTNIGRDFDLLSSGTEIFFIRNTKHFIDTHVSHVNGLQRSTGKHRETIRHDCETVIGRVNYLDDRVTPTRFHQGSYPNHLVQWTVTGLFSLNSRPRKLPRHPPSCVETNSSETLPPSGSSSVLTLWTPLSDL